MFIEDERAASRSYRNDMFVEHESARPAHSGRSDMFIEDERARLPHSGRSDMSLIADRCIAGWF